MKTASVANNKVLAIFGHGTPVNFLSDYGSMEKAVTEICEGFYNPVVEFGESMSLIHVGDYTVVVWDVTELVLISMQGVIKLTQDELNSEAQPDEEMRNEN